MRYYLAFYYLICHRLKIQTGRLASLPRGAFFCSGLLGDNAVSHGRRETAGFQYLPAEERRAFPGRTPLHQEKRPQQMWPLIYLHARSSLVYAAFFSAASACLAIASKPFSSWIAMSDRTLRSNSIPASFRPFISVEYFMP